MNLAIIICAQMSSRLTYNIYVTRLQYPEVEKEALAVFSLNLSEYQQRLGQAY